jgi:hypothetical protein
MNHLILKYGYPITAAILAIFAWVVYRRIAGGSDIVVLAVTAVVVWAIAAPAFLYFWPRLTVDGFRRAIVKRGLGGGPIPVNTLYVTPSTARPSASGASLLGAGTEDLLYLGGWLDLSAGPRVLRTPDMTGRYYSLQFTAPSNSANFAYVGTRTTGASAGSYLLTAPGWAGTVPAGMTRIPSPTASVLVIGRVFVENESDLPAAYALATRIQLEPLRP